MSDPTKESLLGSIGDFDHSNSSVVNVWMEGWKIVGSSATAADAQSSLGVYVGIGDHEDLGFADGMARNRQHVGISTRLLGYCERLSEVWSLFWAYAHSDAGQAQGVHSFRSVLFEHLSPTAPTSPRVIEMLEGASNPIFTRRISEAALRWAIAHEMAHAVTGERARKQYERLIPSLRPDLAVQWRSATTKERRFYLDEMACDLLAVDFVLASPFGRDDLMTQATGSLVALMALIWDGWFVDKSAKSPTHPSPTLRFQTVHRYWMTKFAEPELWDKLDHRPGPLAIMDYAFTPVFERWGAGEYGDHRAGDIWQQDFALTLTALAENLPELSSDSLYATYSDGTLSRLERE